MEEQKQPENMPNPVPENSPGDFFDDLMFGPRVPENREKQKEETLSESVQNPAEGAGATASEQNINPIEQVTELIQTLSPYLTKLTPLLTKAQTFLSNKK